MTRAPDADRDGRTRVSGNVNPASPDTVRL